MSEPIDARYAQLMRNASAKVAQLQAELDDLKRDKTEPIAIIGAGCRFPGGVDSPERFWQFLQAGGDGTGDVPTDRWALDDYYDPDPDAPGKITTRRGGFLERVDTFDPHFFGIAPREAATLDPQQRLLLEVIWETLEHAGCVPSSLFNSATGVYIGICGSDYARLCFQANSAVYGSSEYAAYTGSGTDTSVAAGRLSYTLGLTGPCMSIDTACSSSLVALHLACQSLRHRESDLALAGGVGLILLPEVSIAFSKARMLSPDGRCKTFDATADGYVRGEGCGMVALKRLSDAVTDQDPILALIRGSAVNQDGRSSGLTAPSGPSQQAVIRQALENGGVDSAQVQYVETHGTGTPLGDPIEVGALGAVFSHSRQHPLLIGAVKTNIGHLEAAAGIAGLIKTVLALQHGEIPPTLHFTQPNPHIDWATLPVKVVTEPTPWPVGPRLAGVSAFGFSGTNAHIVLEEAPPSQESEAASIERPLHLLTLSARTEEALTELAARYEAHLKNDADTSLADICFTANVSRTHFPQRLVVAAKEKAEVCAQLAVFAADARASVATELPLGGSPPKVAFLFTGQGAQYEGMGRELYETQPTFRQALDRCTDILSPYLEQSLLEVIYPPGPPPSAEASRLNETAYTQPALFALEYALSELWQSWGIRPDVVLGHSVGEYVAACVAGVFSLEDGLRLIAERGRLMQALPRNGVMVAVRADEIRVMESVAPYAGEVSIAAVNGPQSVVLSGERQAVQAIIKQLTSEGVTTRPLTVSHAFHSPLMGPMLPEFERVAHEVSYAVPRLDFISNITGQLVTDDVITPAYWVRHVQEAVRFTAGMATLQDQHCNVFLELGPQPTLLGMGQQCVSTKETVWVPSLRPPHPDWQQLLGSLGELYKCGVEVDWAGFDQDYVRRKVRVPTYAFQRQSYWLPEIFQERHRAHGALHPLIDTMVKSPLVKETIFDTRFSTAALPFLSDHRVFDEVVVPGACHLAMVLSGAELLGLTACQLENVVFPAALILPEDEERLVQVVLTPDEPTTDGASLSMTFRLISMAELESPREPVTHATGRLVGQTPAAPSPISLADVQARCQEALEPEALYAAARAQQIALGPSFQWLEAVWRNGDEVLARLRVPEAVGRVDDYGLHPGLLDAWFQVAAATLADKEGSDTWMPFAIKTLNLYAAARGQTWWCHARLLGDHLWDIQLCDQAGQIVAELVGFEERQAPSDAALGSRVWRDWLYEVTWQPQAQFGMTPDYLPTPHDLGQQLRPQLDAWMAQADIGRYHEALQQLEALCLDYVAAALRRLGFVFESERQWALPQLAAQLGVVPEYHRLLDRLFEMLSEANIMRRHGASWEVVREPEATDPKLQMQALLAHYGALVEAEWTVTERCGPMLADVLQGTQDPLALLFPDGDTSLAAPLYQDTPSAKVMNTLVQQVILQTLKELPASRGIRLLEVGAGTGGTTSSLIPYLPAEQTQYVFTDIGAGFTTRAQETFKDVSFMHYQPLDIEQDPATQGFAENQYDVVIATNVLHATKDLRETLTHIRRLLAPGGMLILVEDIRRQRWLDLTFGLTEGWWRFADLDVRPDHPLLSTTTWQTLLRTCGFQTVEALPGAEYTQVDAAVIMAQADETVTRIGRQWVLFADSSGVGKQLANHLKTRGDLPVLVVPGTAYEQVEAQTYRINPNAAADYRRVFDNLPEVSGVVYLWSLDEPPILAVHDVQLSVEQECDQVLHLIQTLCAAGRETPPLWMVTHGTQTVAPGEALTGAVQAPLWGMGKVIALEHPELNSVLVDIDAEAMDDMVAALGSELTTWTGSLKRRENQLALRQDRRYVARLARHHRATINDRVPDQPYRLEIGERGLLDSLVLKPVTRQAPAQGEVEIRVRATGLNFIDVLDVLGVLPYGRGNMLGEECAGEIVAIGEGVDTHQVGDAVVAISNTTSFSQYVTLKMELVMPIPKGLSFEEAVTIPVTFMTAYYALHHVGKIAAGDKVLIHAAAGGTGMAAVQIAQQAGAEVYGTASPGKWSALKSLGVKHVYHSRTLDFAETIMHDTDGQGVDVVLNSLTGEGFIAKSLSTLGPHGRFLEIARRDIWDADEVKACRPDVSYHVVDLRRMESAEPLAIQALLREVLQQFDAGGLKPLPRTVFPIHDVVSAFRYMQRARHIGKIVVTQPETRDIPIRDDSTYLITGGTGGLGLQVARWLVEQGARHLVLLARRPPQTEAIEQLDALEQAGARVIVAQADVSDTAQVAGVLAGIDRERPLKGVIHAAGVLDDGILQQQNRERFSQVLGPKVQGAWNLHTLTQDISLDFFVLFSSVASLLGSAGQGNHAAANAFMDTLSHDRRAQGLPALSINWGAWSEVGAAAEFVRREHQRLASQGEGFITPEQGIQIFAYLLGQEAPQVGVVPIDWAKYLGSSAVSSPFFQSFAAALEAERAWVSEHKIGFFQLLQETPAEEQRAVMSQHVRSVVGYVLGLNTPEHIERHQGLQDLGLDSLMAIEVRGRLEADLQCSLPATLLFDYPTLDALTAYLAQEVLALEPVAGDPEPQEPQLNDRLAALLNEIDQTSEAEIQRRLVSDGRKSHEP